MTLEGATNHLVGCMELLVGSTGFHRQPLQQEWAGPLFEM